MFTIFDGSKMNFNTSYENEDAYGKKNMLKI